MIIFLIPLAASVGAVIYFFAVDMDAKWKWLAAVMVALSIAFQFVPSVQTHFLVPLLMQTFVAIWWIFHQKMA